MDTTETMTPVTASGFDWPTDVLAFARANGLEPYLEPVRQVLIRLFPTYRELRVYLYQDHKINDLFRIIFEMRVALADVPDYLAARDRWYAEKFRIVPAKDATSIGFDLFEED